MIIKQLIKSKTIRLQMLNHQRLVIQIAKIVQVVSNLRLLQLFNLKEEVLK